MEKLKPRGTKITLSFDWDCLEIPEMPSGLMEIRKKKIPNIVVLDTNVRPLQIKSNDSEDLF